MKLSKTYSLIPGKDKAKKGVWQGKTDKQIAVMIYIFHSDTFLLIVVIIALLVVLDAAELTLMSITTSGYIF